MSTLKTLQSPGLGATGALADDIRALAPWFHNLHLPGGEQTAPDHPLGDYPSFKWKALATCLPGDMHGLRVLDIGCNAGFFAFECARLGAEVVAMDHDPRYLAQASWAARHLGLASRVSFRRQDVYALAGVRERYDIVLFMGVFYHLRHPLLGLDLAASVCGETLVFQSLGIEGPAGVETGDPGYLGRDRLREDGWPKMAFVEGEFAGDPTNWWLPNPSCMEAMVRSCGFAPQAQSGDVYIARRTGGAVHADERTAALVEGLRSGR